MAGAAVARWPLSLLTGVGRGDRVSARVTILLVAAGPIFALITSIILERVNQGDAAPELLRGILLADLIYVLVISSLIIWRVSRMIAARRAKSAGSRLHLRLSGFFTIIALAPSIMVAIFATLTVNFGIEAWFSSQVRSVVRNALATAEAYEREHRRNIRGDVLAMANDLNRAGQVGIDPVALGELVRSQAIVRELSEAYVFDGDYDILARGEYSYLFSFERPSTDELRRSRAGEVVVTGDQENNEIRALVALTGYLDAFLYVTRPVDGEVLVLLDETRETVALYERLEKERASVLFEYALIYLAFAILVIFAAVWAGLWFAERLSRPIGRLAGAAQRVGGGDLDVRVKEEKGDDEVAVLSRVFNRMTSRVKDQRDALIEANAETDRRRRFIETVLSGLSAGVIGVDADGRIEVMNAAAASMLGSGEAVVGRALADVGPALAPIFDKARGGLGEARDKAVISGATGERELMARINLRSPRNPEEGYVVTLDDMTALVSAQRMAAWGDVAQRVAHEIKNPLTPIQLYAERLKRKIAPIAGEDRAKLEQYADVIVRQAGDIRRMVDEFSQFARTPDPEVTEADLAEIVRDAALMQSARGIDVALEIGPERAPVRCDRGMVGQVLINLLKNAGEAVEARIERDGKDGPPGEIRLALRDDGASWRIEISDNGVGLPEKDRARLAEPYVTTRSKGTGLGLAIATKIAEQHRGRLTLEDAEPFAPGAPRGARAALALPKAGRSGAEA